MTQTEQETPSEILTLAAVLAGFINRGRRKKDSPIPRIVVHSKDSLFELGLYVGHFSAALRTAFWNISRPTEVLVLNADLLAGTASYERAFALRCFEYLDLGGERWIQGLKDVPWTLSSAETAQARLAAYAKSRKWLVFVAGDVDSPELDRASRWLATCLMARAEVICGDLRIRTSASIPDSSHGGDLIGVSEAIPDPDWVVRVAAPVLTTKWIAQAERTSFRPPEHPDRGQLPTRPRNWMSALLKRWIPDKPRVNDAQSDATSIERDSKVISQASDWMKWEVLVRRATFPSVLRLSQVQDQMLVAEIRCDMAIERLKSFAHISLDDEHMLRSRAALLAVLYVQFPSSIDAARTSWSFQPAIFQIQRSILGRDAAQPVTATSTVSDPLLLSLVYQAMTVGVQPGDPDNDQRASQRRPLVPPFPSSSALRRHIDWLFSGGSPPVRAWEGWLEKHLPGRIEALGRDDPIQVDIEAVNVAKQIAKEGWAGPDAAIDTAAWLLELVDLERPLDRPARASPDVQNTQQQIGNEPATFDPPITRTAVLNEAERDWLATALQLLEYALSNSSHGLRLSALLLYARALALGGTPENGVNADRLLEQLQDEARKQKPLQGEKDVLESWKLPVLLTQAYVRELCGDLKDAAEKYTAAAKQARSGIAVEIEWRAALGKLRVQLLQVRLQTQDEKRRSNIERSHFIQRAQILLEVQTARSPHLMRFLKDELPVIFVSYRSKIRSLATHVANVINGSSYARAFIDQDIDNDMQDFAPLIQQKLGSCQAILMVVSENYFESSYCSYEWNTIMARCSLSGYTVPAYWVVCKHQSPEDKTDPDAPAHLHHLVQTAPYEFAEGPAADGLRANFEDLYRRLMASGIALSEKPQPTRRLDDAPDEWIADEKDREALETAILEQIKRLWETWGSPVLTQNDSVATTEDRRK